MTSCGSKLRPWQVRWTGLVKQFYAALVGNEMIFFQHKPFPEWPHDRIVRQQVTQSVVIEKVNDCYNLHIVPVFDNAEYGSPDTSKAVDSNSHDLAAC